MADQAAVSDPNPDNLESEIGNSVLIDDKPVTPPVPVVKQEPVKETPADTGAVEYEPTGDVGLDMALQFVGKAGITGDHPAMVAASKGDFTILKATLAQKGTPGWEQFVALGEAAYTRNQEAGIAKNAALTALVHEAAGGADEWKAVQVWAAANATPEEKQQINAQLNGGNIAAKAAVLYLTSAYNRANNVVVEPRDPAARAGRSGGTPTGDTGPLTSQAYAEAVQQLNNKLAGRLEGSKEYAALQSRRLAALR